MNFNHAVRDQFQKDGQQRGNLLFRIYKLDSHWYVFTRFVGPGFVNAMMGSEAYARIDDRRARRPTIQQKIENFLAKKVVARHRILVEIDGDFLRRANTEHFFTYKRGSPRILLKTSQTFSERVDRVSSESFQLEFPCPRDTL